MKELLRGLARGLAIWLIRCIPLIGYTKGLEDENAKLRRERDALLDRILAITTGAGLIPDTATVNAAAPARSYSTTDEFLRSLEEKSREALAARVGADQISYPEFKTWIETGAMPTPKTKDAAGSV